MFPKIAACYCCSVTVAVDVAFFEIVRRGRKTHEKITTTTVGYHSRTSLCTSTTKNYDYYMSARTQGRLKQEHLKLQPWIIGGRM